MNTRCSCFNCGFVDDYKLPYHSKIREYDNDTVPTATGSTVENDEGQERPFLCNNCGWNMLEVVFWDKARTDVPFLPLRQARP